ncbi:c-type cytochrome biogenesis protein CcmI [Caulobacter sp. KR2-114]|uniref:c-type cytochrome biogenesis protein CcmI n=1 Tax=Caulobacter sp. KR2-114 TaxID=3400912 RepID=UPI003C015A4D
MIMIWIAAALMAALSAGLVMHRAARGARLAGAPDPAMDVYRRQLAEIDDLADRGLIADDERRAARAETGRRLLSQADAAVAPLQSRVRPAAVMLFAGAPALLAVVLYAVVGEPAMPDLPFKARLANWRGEVQRWAAHPDTDPPLGLAAVLADDARAHPEDPRPLRGLAALDEAVGDAPGAAHALRRLAQLTPNDPAVWEMLAKAQISQAQGKIDAQAEASVQKLLALDPGNANARYVLARARILRGDTTGGLADWKALYASLPANDPNRPGLAADIDAVQKTGKPAPPAAAPEPPAAQATAPGTAAMIQGMVDGLAARLKASPDDPAGWVRLVRAYSVLGQTEKRDAALAEARRRYGARPDVLSQLNDAAAPQR